MVLWSPTFHFHFRAHNGKYTLVSVKLIGNYTGLPFVISIMRNCGIYHRSEVFTLPVSQMEIGHLVDTSRESVSRILSEFHNDGIIRLANKKVEILNKESLLLIGHTG
ncbi:MAG: helix-turn-helix domain-containing protein [Bacteroidales bacterium]|nr:helix-turn-helix domain-containing protein [Bacteroidales bacterium]